MKKVILTLFLIVFFSALYIVQSTTAAPIIYKALLEGPHLSLSEQTRLQPLGEYPQYPQLDTLTFDFGPISEALDPLTGLFTSPNDLIYIGIQQQTSLSEPYFTPHNHPRTNTLISMNGIQTNLQPEECLWEIVTGNRVPHTGTYMTNTVRFISHDPIITNIDPPVGISPEQLFGIYKQPSILPTETDGHLRLKCWVVLAGAAGDYNTKYSPTSTITILFEPSSTHIQSSYSVQHFPHRGDMSIHQILPSDFEIRIEGYSVDSYNNEFIKYELSFTAKNKNLFYGDSIMFALQGLSKVYKCDGIYRNNEPTFSQSTLSFISVDSLTNEHIYRFDPIWKPIDPAVQTGKITFRIECQWSGINQSIGTDLKPFRPLFRAMSRFDYRTIVNGVTNITPIVPTSALALPLTKQLNPFQSNGIFTLTWDNTHTNTLQQPLLLQFTYNLGMGLQSEQFSINVTGLSTYTFNYATLTNGISFGTTLGYDISFKWVHSQLTTIYTEPLAHIGQCTSSCAGIMEADINCECQCQNPFFTNAACDICGTPCINGSIDTVDDSCTTCKCSSIWFTGDLCDYCALSCGHNGKPNEDCTECIDCDGGWTSTRCDTCHVMCPEGFHFDDNCVECIPCDPHHTGFRCLSCMDGWSGSNCEICTNGLQCDNGGEPNDDCTACSNCSGQWSGDDCNTCTITCESQNGQSWIPDDDCTMCQCNAGYSGQFCDIPVWCGNSCPNGVANDSCEGCKRCNDNWTGVICDICTLTCLEDEIPNNDCTACIPSSITPPCELICQHNGIPNNDCTECINCDEHWMGKNCDQCQPLLTCLLPFITDSDNTCSKCINPYQQCENYYGGNDCQTCNLICYNNGKIGINCDRCICTSQNYNGAQCQCRIITYTLRLTTIPQQLLQQFQNDNNNDDDDNDNTITNNQSLLNYIKQSLISSSTTSTTNQLTLSTSMMIQSIQLDKSTTPQSVLIRGQLSDNCQMQQNNYHDLKSIWDQFKIKGEVQLYDEEIPIKLVDETIPNTDSCDDELYGYGNDSTKCQLNHSFQPNIHYNIILQYFIFITIIFVLISFDSF